MAFQLWKASEGGTAPEDGASLLLFPRGATPSANLEPVAASMMLPASSGGPTPVSKSLTTSWNVILSPKVNTAEGGSEATAVTTGNSGGISGDAFTVQGSLIETRAASARSGDFGYYIPGGTGTINTIEWTTPADIRGSASFWFKIEGFPAAETRLLAFRNATPTNLCGIYFTNLGKLRVMINTSGASGASESPALSTNTWYLVQIAYKVDSVAANGTVDFKIFNNDLSTFHSYSGVLPAGVTGTGGIARLWWGRPLTSSDFTTPVHLDNFRFEGGRDTTISEAVVIPVSKSLSTTWNTLETTTTPVSKTLSTSWNVNSQISKALATSWNVQSSITKALSTSWNVYQAVSKSFVTTWDVFAIGVVSVSRGFSTTWNARAYVSKPLSTSWNTRAYVTDVFVTSWNVQAYISKPFSTTWNTRAFATKNLATSWNVQSFINKALATSWNVNKNVTKPLSTTWNVRAYASKSLATSWNVRSIVAKPFATSWNIYTIAGPKSLATTWKVRGLVTKNLSTTWHVMGESQWALWNGTTLETLTLEGWWDGNAVQPITPWTGEMST